MFLTASEPECSGLIFVEYIAEPDSVMLQIECGVLSKNAPPAAMHLLLKSLDL